jgi:hypothetical protein
MITQSSLRSFSHLYRVGNIAYGGISDRSSTIGNSDFVGVDAHAQSIEHGEAGFAHEDAVERPQRGLAAAYQIGGGRSGVSDSVLPNFLDDVGVQGASRAIDLMGSPPTVAAAGGVR